MRTGRTQRRCSGMGARARASDGVHCSLRQQGEREAKGTRWKFGVAAHLSPGSEFLDTLARHYGAGLFLAPFESAGDASRQAINRR